MLEALLFYFILFWFLKARSSRCACILDLDHHCGTDLGIINLTAVLAQNWVWTIQTNRSNQGEIRAPAYELCTLRNFADDHSLDSLVMS